MGQRRLRLAVKRLNRQPAGKGCIDPAGPEPQNVVSPTVLLVSPAKNS